MTFSCRAAHSPCSRGSRRPPCTPRHGRGRVRPCGPAGHQAPAPPGVGCPAVCPAGPSSSPPGWPLGVGARGPGPAALPPAGLVCGAGKLPVSGRVSGCRCGFSSRTRRGPGGPGGAGLRVGRVTHVPRVRAPGSRVFARAPACAMFAVSGGTWVSRGRGGAHMCLLWPGGSAHVCTHVSVRVGWPGRPGASMEGSDRPHRWRRGWLSPRRPLCPPGADCGLPRVGVRRSWGPQAACTASGRGGPGLVSSRPPPAKGPRLLQTGLPSGHGAGAGAHPPQADRAPRGLRVPLSGVGVLLRGGAADRSVATGERPLRGAGAGRPWAPAGQPCPGLQGGTASPADAAVCPRRVFCFVRERSACLAFRARRARPRGAGGAVGNPGKPEAGGAAGSLRSPVWRGAGAGPRGWPGRGRDRGGLWGSAPCSQ